MKRIIIKVGAWTLGLTIFMLFLALASFAQTVNCTGDKYTIKCEAKAAAAAAVFTTTKIPYTYQNMWLCAVKHKPDATQPTAAWDYTLTDEFGVDLMGGAGTDRSESATQIDYPIVDSVSGQRACVPVRSNNLSIAISNNAVNNAGILFELVFDTNK